MPRVTKLLIFVSLYIISDIAFGRIATYLQIENSIGKVIVWQSYLFGIFWVFYLSTFRKNLDFFGELHFSLKYWAKISLYIIAMQFATSFISMGIFGSSPSAIVRPFEISGPIVFLSIVLIGPFVEEFIFRGRLFNVSAKVVSKGVAIAVTTLLIAAIHLPINYSVAVLGASIGFTYVYANTRNLPLAIFCHATGNLITFILAKSNTSPNTHTNLELWEQFVCMVLGIALFSFTFYKLRQTIHHLTENKNYSLN